MDPRAQELTPACLAADPTAAIIRRNIETGRYDRVCVRAGRRLSVEEYARLVERYYAAHGEWIARLTAGDRAAWSEQWRILYCAAYGMLQRAGWEPERAVARAQEAAQETCASLYCRTFPFDCPYDAWAFTILRRQVFNLRRRPRGPLDIPGCDELGEEDVAIPGPEEALEYDEAVLAAVEDLPTEKQREVIYCLFFQELDPAETAERIGCSRQAVYNAKHRALLNLARLLTIRRNH